jgi:glutaredoxin 3
VASKKLKIGELAQFGESIWKRRNMMKQTIEIFSAGCKTCRDEITTVKKLVGPQHEVIVSNMQDEEIATRAAQHGVRSVPALVIDGKLTGCCAGRGFKKTVLREALG